MSEELLNNEANKAEQEKIENIKKSLDRLKKKESKFLFTIPEVPHPSASVYEMYFHANVVKKMGYKVIVLTEKEDYVAPKWIDKELTDLEYIPMSKPDLVVGPEDIMVIPEVFSNVMEQTKNLPCKRIGLLQSVDYMLNALVPGTTWKSFNINDIITTSKTLKEFMDSYYGVDVFNIKVYNPGIPDYFKRTDEPQKPIISVIGRNPNEISKIVKLFFSRYPQYSWVGFDPMLTKSKPPQPMRRKDFAKRLRGNFAAIWVDRISSWGTFPLECMKSGVLPICLKPDITPEYILDRKEDSDEIEYKQNLGLWTDNLYDIPVYIGEALVKFLDDNIDDELYDDMEKAASEFTMENAENQLISTYQLILDERISAFTSIVNSENKLPGEKSEDKPEENK
jgi:hypothetical protein